MKQTQWHSSKGNSCRQITLAKQKLLLEILETLYVQRQRQAFRVRRNGFFGGNFLFRISELTQRERIYVHFANYRFSFRKLQRFSFRKLQILILRTTDFHFANYRFPFRKLQILISQTTDSHFANYRFPFRKLQISISFRKLQ